MLAQTPARAFSPDAAIRGGEISAATGCALRQGHRAGHKLFVDCAGATIPSQDRNGRVANARHIVLIELARRVMLALWRRNRLKTVWHLNAQQGGRLRVEDAFADLHEFQMHS